LCDINKTADALLGSQFFTRLFKEHYMTHLQLKYPFSSWENLHKSFEPFTVGFGDTFETLRDAADQLQKAAGYPPYNIKKVKDNKFVIEMAVAGFAKSDIEITLEGSKLVVRGTSKDNQDENFLYKGIADRNFTREFTLADKVEVDNVEMVNGMLKIWLENLVKAQDTVKKLTIK
jgi:molecular chaperone IbpA